MGNGPDVPARASAPEGPGAPDGEDPERWSRVKELLADCIEDTPDRRDARLAAADPALRERVRSLLDAYNGAPPALGRFIVAEEVERDVRDENEAASPFRLTHVGPYRLGRLLGEGGTGLVYEAFQEHPERTVAVKILRPSVASARAIERFRSEVEILGRLQHPGIAAIFGAGLGETDAVEHELAVPWLAMELVDGVPLTQHAASLPVARRLALFLDVCEAVHYAHQRGVIHRDLKPQNILVTRPAGADAPARVRVLDFGIARVTGAHSATHAPLTLPGLTVGTLPYMSPEQVSGDPTEQDVRADVYALGVVLYELLAGRLPIDVADVPASAAIRRIVEMDPPPPSTFDRALAGDLDTIAAKALAKEKDRRYAGVAELATDVRRFLRHEPILARRPSPGYLLAKFTRRHRGLVFGLAVAAVLFVVSVGSIVVSLDRTRVERDKATAVVRLLRQMLKAASPYEAGADVTVASVLDHTVATLGSSHPPEVEATLRRAIGETYMQLRRDAEGIAQLERSVALFRQAHGHDDERALDAEVELALVTAGEGADDLVERCDGALGPDHPVSLRARVARAGVLAGENRRADAERLLRETIERLGILLGDDDDRTLFARSRLAQILTWDERHDEAIALRRELLSIRRATHGDDHGETVAAQYELAVLLDERAYYAEAEALFRGIRARAAHMFGVGSLQTFVFEEALAHNLVQQRKLDEAESILMAGVEHARSLGLLPQRLNSLAVLCSSQGRREEAEELARRAFEATRLQFGDDAIATWVARDNLASCLDALGRTDEALDLLDESLSDWRGLRGPTHPDLVGPLNYMGNCLAHAQRWTEAEVLFRDAVAIARSTMHDGHVLRATSITSLGLCLARLERWDEAEPLLVEAEDAWRDQPVGYRDRLAMVLLQLEDLYIRTGRPALAAGAHARRDALDRPAEPSSQ